MARNADGLGTRPHKWRGRWRAALTVGYDALGRPDRRWVYGLTQAECQAKLDELRAAAKHGLTRTDRQTLAEYLATWLDGIAPTVSARTVEIYRADARHLLPHIGRVQLTKLTPAHVQKAMRAIVGTEVKFGRRGADGHQTAVLTPRSANAARLVLHNALAAAVADGLIPFNPAAKERAKPLRQTTSEITVWSAAEIEAFLNTCLAGACALYPFYYTALTTGLRVGELGALEWRDVTTTALTITRSLGSDGTKTPTGRRVVPLASDTVSVLEQHRAAQESTSALVFPTSNGRPVTRAYARTSLHRWATKAGVTLLSPHGLRHTYASMAISAGMSAPELARVLGHTSPAFTLRRYVHFFERAEGRRALTLAELTGSENRKVVFLGGTDGSGATDDRMPN